jgi:Ni/Co efflux regulator RcnB
MKNLVSIVVAVSLAVAFAASAFAGGTPTTKAECEKAGMHWDEKTNACHKM